MGHFISWIGLWLSLNQTVPFKPVVINLQPNVEATALVKVGKLTISSVYIQPLTSPSRPILDVGVGIKVF